MTHCIICGVLDNVGEVVICEDCTDKLSEHDVKIAEIAKIAKKERERLLHIIHKKLKGRYKIMEDAGRKQQYVIMISFIKSLGGEP